MSTELILTPPTPRINSKALREDVTKYADNHFVNYDGSLLVHKAYHGPVTLTITTNYPLETDPQKIFGNPTGYLGNRAVIFFNFTGKNPTESIDNMYTGPITLTADGGTYSVNGRTITLQNSGDQFIIKARVKYLGKWSKTIKSTIRVI